MARVAGAEERVRLCQQAILERDFATFAAITEHDSNLMHAVMMTSRPPLFYWQPPSLAIMQRVRELRADGLNVCFSFDAGPNPHMIAIRKDADQVRQAVEEMSGVMEIRMAGVGGGAELVATPER